MKKLFLAGAMVLGTISLYSCGGDEATTAGDDEMVIERDTTVSEIEVEKTVVETDTMTESETIELEEGQ